MCTRVLICCTVFTPPTNVEQIRTRVQICTGCIFIKHRLHDQNTPQVQIYTPGVYLHWGVYCAYERGFRCPYPVCKNKIILVQFGISALDYPPCAFLDGHLNRVSKSCDDKSCYEEASVFVEHGPKVWIDDTIQRVTFVYNFNANF